MELFKDVFSVSQPLAGDGMTLTSPKEKLRKVFDCS